MKRIRISKTLALPLDVVTQTIAAIARKGGGKTYFATLLAEEMILAGAQVVVIDIVGNWYGLRLGPGGRGKGVDVYVFGGEHGDLPLTPDSGPRIARLLVERQISVVLDISAFRKAERLRFAAQFAEEFYHLKKTQKSAVHVFVEEAQKLIPQMVKGESAAMVGAWEDIVRLGRNYGIGCTLVTQRPQSVNKEVLSQVEMLVVLQVNGVHERKALTEWVQEKGADRALVGELPGLAVGEAYVWSPSWLRIFERVKIAQKRTYDASATPEVGARRREIKLSKTDVKVLREELAEVVAKAERDDPSALKRRIAELEREVARKTPAAPAATRTIETLVLREREAKRLEKVIERAGRIVERAHGVADSVAALVAARVEKIAQKQPPPPPAVDPRIATAQSRFLARRGLPSAPAPARGRRPVVAPVGGSAIAPGDAKPLKAGARTMLRVLAGMHGNACPRTALAVHSIISQTGGTFSDYLSSLRSAGYLADYTNDVGLTPEGVEAAGEFGSPILRGAREIAGAWGASGKLKAGARRMLDVLLSRGESEISRESLAADADVTGTGGTFSDYLSSLRSAGLIETNGGLVRAAGCLFIHGS